MRQILRLWQSELRVTGIRTAVNSMAVARFPGAYFDSPTIRDKVGVSLPQPEARSVPRSAGFGKVCCSHGQTGTQVEANNASRVGCRQGLSIGLEVPGLRAQNDDATRMPACRWIRNCRQRSMVAVQSCICMGSAGCASNVTAHIPPR
jgi:hypothetical protein